MYSVRLSQRPPVLHRLGTIRTMVLTSRSINYAAFDGIHHNELPIAIVFCALYVPWVLLYVSFSLRKPTFVFRILVIFCLGWFLPTSSL